MPIEERQLLRPVGGIVGGVQIEGDAAGPSVQTAAAPLDQAVGQSLRQAK